MAILFAAWRDVVEIAARKTNHIICPIVVAYNRDTRFWILEIIELIA